MEFPSQLDIDFVRKLDSEDKLAGFRNLFHFSDPDVCYLDGNSLGRLPKRTVDEVNSFLTNEWGHELVIGSFSCLYCNHISITNYGRLANIKFLIKNI